MKITNGTFLRYPHGVSGKRFFVMNTAIAVDGTTTIPTEAEQGSIGVTTHNTGKSYWFVSDGTHWIANGGAVSSTAFADITGSPNDHAALAAILAALAAKTTFQIKSANFTAVAGNKYQVNTSGGVITCTLPATATAGDEIVLEDAALTWDTNPLTLNRNGLKINSGTTNYTANIEGGKLSCVYISAGIGWSIK